MKQRMTHDEARLKLRRYYKILEVVQQFRLRSTDIIIAVGQDHSAASPTEVEVVRRLDLLASVEDTEEALLALTGEQRRFCELRFSQELSLRQIAGQMYRPLGAMTRIERDTLSAFIAALGCVPMKGI